RLLMAGLLLWQWSITAYPEDVFPELDLETRITAVNEGDLRFLKAGEAVNYHLHLNKIEITEVSFDEGWVTLRQCHENIDAVPSAQILYRAGRIQNLIITASRNIGSARVEGHSVQLEDVSEQARLCVEGESRALVALGGGGYALRNGPFMRRFLDGYYPMRVLIEITFPVDELVLTGIEPSPQVGFEVVPGEGVIKVDALFEGRLSTCFLFCEPDSPNCIADPHQCRVLPPR
ncbi:MAG: hypothetical protein U9Q81_19370, partial [Pseudomonadota bacterium]|nr:hypothetical protein [Pseudomonadota bacterium]